MYAAEGNRSTLLRVHATKGESIFIECVNKIPLLDSGLSALRNSQCHPIVPDTVHTYHENQSLPDITFATIIMIPMCA